MTDLDDHFEAYVFAPKRERIVQKWRVIQCQFVVLFLIKGIILFLALSTLGNTAEPAVIKQTILAKKQALQKVSSEHEKAKIFYDLARAYHEDQEIAQAFIYFLEALKRVEKRALCPMELAEKNIYESALSNYLAHVGLIPEEAAKELLDRYGEVAAAHSDYVHLNFLIATAYANLGRYNDFFERFYRGYPYLNDSFLAYKTQGILYLRLSQLSSCLELRQSFQQEASHLLTAALERNAGDASLYKVLVLLAKDQKDDTLVRTYLRGMVTHETPIPRGDISFYVREAARLGEWGICQTLIDQARALYNYSRAVSAAQEYLNQNKG